MSLARMFTAQIYSTYSIKVRWNTLVIQNTTCAHCSFKNSDPSHFLQVDEDSLVLKWGKYKNKISIMG